MNNLFGQLRQQSFLKNTNDAEFVDELSEFLAGLNAVHPFREGNGRAQLSFAHIIAEKALHPLDFARVQQHTFLRGMIESFSGNMAPLKREIRALLI